MTEPRLATIEGRPTIVQRVDTGLPRKLEGLLNEMAAFGFTYRADPQLAGARTACTVLREHRWTRFREGRWYARRGIRVGQVLDLHLRMCADCGGVEVRDVSYDRLAGLPIGRGGPSRRSHILGRYSGARPRGRVHL